MYSTILFKVLLIHYNMCITSDVPNCYIVKLNSFTLNLTKIMQLHCMQTFYVILLHNHKLFGNIKSLNWFWYYAKFKYKLYYSMFTINSFTYANRFVCERVLNITKTFPLLKCLLKFTLLVYPAPHALLLKYLYNVLHA